MKELKFIMDYYKHGLQSTLGMIAVTKYKLCV